MFQVDLNNCDREPIHIPGRIQSHGFLIAVDDVFVITHCSTGVFEWLGCSPRDLLDKPVSTVENFLDQQENSSGAILHLLQASQALESANSPTVFKVSIRQQPWSFSLSRNKTHYLLDFEPDYTDLNSNLQNQIGKSLSLILGDKNLDILLSNVVKQVRSIIGYDRVMVYQFHEDGHGEVVAEDREESLGTWLGLHYPASDIPAQARELYKSNLIRLIADVDAEPSDLVSNDENALDLTNSNLRAVSPIHIQYLKNMGVASSFSISILDHNKLWGLIACHNYTPRYINVHQRQDTKLIGQVLSSAISFRHNEIIQNANVLKKEKLSRITRYLLSSLEVPDALLNKEHTVMDIIPSEGVILNIGGCIYTKGNTPQDNELIPLVAWIVNRVSDSVLFETDRLSAHFPEAIAYKQIASGLMACRLGADSDAFIAWLKPERISYVNWAGKPDKAISVDERGIATISPRLSFDIWSETVRNTSSPWTQLDKLVAEELVDEINYAVSRRASELKMVNEKLKVAYSELDAFSYTISHDLKTPLASIKGYAQLLSRGMDEEKVRSMADRIQVGALKMQNMIDEVLNYSKIGQSSLCFNEVNMDSMLAELREDFQIASDLLTLKINIGKAFPLHGDEVMLGQVFSNLLSNAIKYSSRNAYPVVHIESYESVSEVIYTITDNGVGIPVQDHEKIFELFSRSQTGSAYEGTGVGLAIVKKIVEKHSGKIWLESRVGEGTTFFIRFPRLVTAS